MHRTPFAGLTAPDPDDAALQVDGGSFVNRNPDLIDFFLSIGCISHRHDAHAPLAEPQFAPSAVVIPSGGTIESGLDLYFGWTASDSYGGETVLSPPTLVSTADPAPDPTTVLDVVFESASGVMPVGTRAYAITVMDAGGGEGTIGPATSVQREAGFASGQMRITNLTGDLVNDGDRWRLWRSDDGGPFNLIAVGVEDEFVDWGIDPVDHAATPPLDSSRTRSTSSVQVTLPMAAGASANAVLQDSHTVAFNLYLSLDGSFGSPALVAVFPLASAGATVTLTDTFTEPGAPPEVATSIRGANKIDPDTELIDWHWKRPVASASLLPLGSATASGDVRVVLEDGLPYRFLNEAWGLWDISGIDVDDGTTFLHGVKALHFVGSGVSVSASGASGATVLFASAGGGGGGGGSGITLHYSKVAHEGISDMEFAPDGLQAQVTFGGASGEFATVIHKPAPRTETQVPGGATFIASGASAMAGEYLAPGARLLRVSAPGPCRVRIYINTNDQVADQARPVGVEPTGDHGLIWEHVFEAGDLVRRLGSVFFSSQGTPTSPNVADDDTSNGGGSDDPWMPVSIENYDADGDCYVNVIWQQAEPMTP